MGLSCGMKCLKYLLFAFNIVFWVLGVAILGIGIWSRIKAGKFDDLIDDSTIPSAANIMIGAGTIVMLIGFLGCCGAWKENKCMLISYAICLILIFILEIAAGIYAYVKKDDVQKKLEKGIREAIKTSYGQGTKSDKGLTEAVDWFQENVKCCGAANASEWKNSAWYKSTGKKVYEVVPKSCCITVKDGCSRNNTISWLLTSKTIHPEGCVEQGKKFVKYHIYQVGGAALGIAFIQLLGIIFAICLCRSIGEHESF